MNLKFEPYDKWAGHRVRPAEVPRGLKVNIEGNDLIIISDLRTSQLANKKRIEKIVDILIEHGIIIDN